MPYKAKPIKQLQEYPETIRKRAFELWMAHERSFYKVSRQIQEEFNRMPHFTTVKRWAADEDWAGRADTLESSLSTFTGFKKYIWTPYLHAPHLELIDTKLTELTRYLDTGGQEGIRRLMIFMPPRHGKSMTVSRLFPAWFLGTHPDFRVVLTGYAMSLVARHSTFTRKLIGSPRYRAVFPQVKIARNGENDRGSWEIARHEGGLDAMGMHGPIMGKGAHLLIIDDPVKNRQAAFSRRQRESMWEDYRLDLLSRLEPNAVTVLMMTRWHEDDLAGRLLKSEGEKWEVIRLPAIAESLDIQPARRDEIHPVRSDTSATNSPLLWRGVGGEVSGDLDIIGRKHGEALWAARYPVSELEEIRASMGAVGWAALYQQNPMPVDGGLFKTVWIDDKRDENVPPLARIYVSIDPAAGSGERAAETGIIVAGVDKRKPSHAYVLADLSVKATPAEWGRIALEAVKTWKADAVVLEVNQGGEMAAGTLRAIDSRVRIQQVRATRDKFLRADPVAALYEQGRVHHAGKFPKLEEQMVRWTPGDPSPDRLDALVWALTELMITVQGVGLR